MNHTETLQIDQIPIQPSSILMAIIFKPEGCCVVGGHVAPANLTSFLSLLPSPYCDNSQNKGPRTRQYYMDCICTRKQMYVRFLSNFTTPFAGGEVWLGLVCMWVTHQRCFHDGFCQILLPLVEIIMVQGFDY